MEIVQVPIVELKPSEYNPRKASEKEWKDLENSIQEFGLVDPIIVNSAENRKNIIIGGHFRLKVAEKLNLKEVPVVYLDIPDIEKERELNLRLNKNLGEWDYDLLANFDDEFLKDVGFESEELDKIFGLIEEDEFDVQKEYEAIEEPKTKLGDLYQLGEHKLLCEDSTLKESFEKLMGNEKAQLVFTDPPYNVGYDYTVRYVKGRIKKKNKRLHIFSDNKTSNEFVKFIQTVFDNCYEYSLDNSTFYCWHATKTQNEVWEGIENSKWYISQTLYWLKNNNTFFMGQDYLPIIEPCFFGWKKKQKHFINKKTGLKFANILMLDINDFEELLDVLYQSRDKIKDYIHPTQKPIRLAERAIKKHSNQNDIILDPFLGSGSTMIACEQLNRKCYAIELDPKYCDVAVKRWEQFTGKEVQKIWKNL